MEDRNSLQINLEKCRYTFQQIHRYRSKISGPLMDRIDIHVEVPAVPYKALMG